MNLNTDENQKMYIPAELFLVLANQISQKKLFHMNKKMDYENFDNPY